MSPTTRQGRPSASSELPAGARRLILIAAVLLPLVVAGCSKGESEKQREADVAKSKAEAATTACADKAKAVPLPASFPKDFPLPPHLVVTKSEKRSGNQTIVTAVSADPFKAVLKQLQTGLPKAGLKPTEGEVEARDAESNFSGPSYKGRWTLREIPTCDADTLVTVLVAPS
jgi:hypothetical protein